MDNSSGNLAAEKEQKMSELFRDPTADVTFVSSDHILFKIHGKHINSNSAGFAIAENTIVGSDVVQLTEPSETLEILFQFIEPPSESQNYRQPSVFGMESSLFFEVAEAAEKYIVYGVMNTCITCMRFINIPIIRHRRQLISQHSLEVLNHCAKHGYTDLADLAAKEALSQSLDMAAAKLTAPGVLSRWLTYYNKWKKASNSAAQLFENKSPHKCTALAYIYGTYLRHINEKPATFKTIPLTSSSVMPICSTQRADCLCKSLHAECWCKMLRLRIQLPWIDSLNELQNNIPKFSNVTM